MPFATPANRHGRAFPQVLTDSRPLRQAKRRGRASSAIGECAAADEREGNFSAFQSFENSENAERISPQGRLAPLHSPLRSRACPEMAPQGLEKIESAPGNGRVSEASNPQDVVHIRAAGPYPIGSLSPGARPAKQRRRRRFIAPTNEEENFPPRKALKSHKTRKSTREGSLPELAASSRSFDEPPRPRRALGRDDGDAVAAFLVQGLGERQIPLAEGGYRDEKIWEQLCWVCDPYNPLKFHKTAKAFFGNPCTKLAEILKSLEKRLGARLYSAISAPPLKTRLRHRPARGRPPPEA